MTSCAWASSTRFSWDCSLMVLFFLICLSFICKRLAYVFWKVMPNLRILSTHQFPSTNHKAIPNRKPHLFQGVLIEQLPVSGVVNCIVSALRNLSSRHPTVALKIFSSERGVFSSDGSLLPHPGWHFVLHR